MSQEISFEEIKSQSYGRLVVLLETTPKFYNKRKLRRFTCRCSCGKIKDVYLSSLRSGDTKSCGCFSKEIRTKIGKYKGISNNSPLYLIWYNMVRRCYNPNHKAYKLYGKRGITVCKEWKNNFYNFYNWAVNEYQKGLQLDRINNNLGYSPDNCRWVISKINVRNSRITKLSQKKVDYIRNMKDKKSGNDLAKQFNVHREHIYAIQRNRYWQ